MRLYLLRHGEAEKNSPTGKDFDKSLTEIGREQVERVKNRLLKEAEDLEFTVFCSTAQRTRETWQILAAAVSVKEIAFLDELYLADHNHLLNFLWNTKSVTNDVLIVGHNNGISDLASYFLDDRYVLPASGLLVIDFPEAKDFSETSLGSGVKVSKCYPVEE